MGSARYVWELSRAILADVDGYVAVIRTYMDESGTHEGSPYVTVGAYAGQPKHWKAFTKEWNFRKKPDGIAVYHATDCANQRGEFEGWSVEQCNTFAAKMLPILPKHPPIGVVIGIDMNAFEEGMKAAPELREMIGTPYACCFQWVVQRLLSIVEGHGSNERLAFFHERNDYKKEADEAFDWIIRHRRRHSSEMTLTFGTKEQYVPLQAADILAYEGNKRMQGIDAGRRPRRSWTALDPAECILIVGRFGRDNMPWLIDRLKLARDEIKTYGAPLSSLEGMLPLPGKRVRTQPPSR